MKSITTVVSNEFEIIQLTDFCPMGVSTSTFKRSVRNLSAGLFTYSASGKIGKISVVSRISSQPASELVQCLAGIILKHNLSTYHTRAMRRLSPTTLDRSHHLQSLQYFYNELTGEVSTTMSARQAELDSYIKNLSNLKTKTSFVISWPNLNYSTARANELIWQECNAHEIEVAIENHCHTDVQ